MATAKQKIIDILYEDGAIDNYFCLKMRITSRLGAYINSLSKKGWGFTGEFLKGTKNYQYIVVKYPSENSDSKNIKKPIVATMQRNNLQETRKELLHLQSKKLGGTELPMRSLFP